MTLHQLLLKTGQLAFQLNINVVLHTDLVPFVRVGDFTPTPTLATVQASLSHLLQSVVAFCFIKRHAIFILSVIRISKTRLHQVRLIDQLARCIAVSPAILELVVERMIARVEGVLLLLQSLLLLLLQLLRVDRCYRRVTSFLLLAVLVVGVAKLQRHLEGHLLGWHQVHG